MHPSSLKHMAQKVEQHLAPDSSLRIVDIGSQDVNGSFRSLFDKPDWHYTGVDLCEGTNVDLVLDDPYHFPFNSDSVDVIVSGSVFEHVEFFWQTFTEMCRVVRPGGMVILIMPSRGPEHRYPVDCWRFYPDGMSALARLSSVELVEAHTDWDDTGIAGSKLWGDTVGVFRMPDTDEIDKSKPLFDHPEISVRELLGEPDLLIPSSCTNHEENLLRAVLHGEEYQLPNLPLRLRNAPVFDVGANLGMFSTAVRRHFPDAPIHAVEPSARNLAILHHNLGKIKNVQIHPCCLGDRNETTTFHLGGATSGLADSLYTNRLSSDGRIEVEVRDAKRLFESHINGELAILKLDTEGHEIPILSRLADEIPHIAAIMVEYHSEHDRRAIDDLLKGEHDLYFSHASVPHRGTCCYLRRDIIAEIGEDVREIRTAISPDTEAVENHMEQRLRLPLNALLTEMQDRILSKTQFLGVQTLKNPLDMWVIQEIIWEQKPDIIIELGTRFGGSALAFASLCDQMNHGRILSVDVNHKIVHEKTRNHPRITLFEGDACECFHDVVTACGEDKNILIIEDSSHTFDNTLNILRTYSPIIPVGGYFIVEDSICHHGLDVGPDPGPYEAIEAFLAENPAFVTDRERESFVVTWNPMGYLRREK